MIQLLKLKINNHFINLKNHDILHKRASSNTLFDIMGIMDVSSSERPGQQKETGGKNRQKLTKPRLGPQKYTVFDKNFVTENLKAKDVLTNYQAFFTETDEYNFNGLVLEYVTPWNNHGYDIAKIFGNKFTHISPVWLQIHRRGPAQYEVTGIHDIDKQWFIDVRNAGRERKTIMIPRVLFDGWTGKDYTELLNNPEEVEAVNEVLIQACKQYGFDGFVFEVWSQLAGAIQSEVLVELIQVISEAFQSKNLQFILVIPPKRGDTDLFTETQFNTLYDSVTAFSLMTYDYSSPQRPGPNAPIRWIEDTITAITSNESKRPKILMGLNFYGNDYVANDGGPIVAHEYIDRLKTIPEKALKYIPEVAEHYVEYRDDQGVNHLIFYPTLYSIFQRLDLAHRLKVGISIWEIGQGLDYFYDLL